MVSETQPASANIVANCFKFLPHGLLLLAVTTV